MRRWIFTIKTARKELARRQLLIWELEREVADRDEQLKMQDETITIVAATRDEYARRLAGCHRLNQDLISEKISFLPKEGT